MSHSDELPSANALSALQHHLSGTLSLSPFRTVTRLHYLNLDLKHICSPPFMLLQLSCSPAPLKPRQHGALQILYCIVFYCKAHNFYIASTFWFNGWRRPVHGLCNGRVSVRPSVCPVDSSCRLSIHICRRSHSVAASGQRQCCDPRRIDADLLENA